MVFVHGVRVSAVRVLGWWDMGPKLGSFGGIGALGFWL